MRLDGATLATLSYDANSELATVTYGYGVALSQILRDDQGRTKKTVWSKAGVTIASDEVTYSRAGRVVTDTTGTAAGASTSTYGYDTVGRLISSLVDGQAWQYGFGVAACGQAGAGKNSNRTSVTGPAGTSTFCYDANDRLVSTTDASIGTPVYDGHGNTTQIAGRTLTFDQSDRNVSTTQPGGTVGLYEAELAVRSSPYPLVESVWPGYTGTGSLGGWLGSGQFVTFTVTGTAGPATLSFRYAAGAGAGVRKLTVNGTVVNATLPFPATSSWTAWTQVNVPVTLIAGSNTVTLTYDAGSSGYINLDSLVVQQGTPASVLLEAEWASRTSPNPIAENVWAGYTGTGSLGGWGGDGQQVTFSVTAAAGGAGVLSFRYANGAGAGQRRVQVNGGAWVQVPFITTGAWTTWSTVTVPVSLVAGANTVVIGFDSASGSAGWVNLDSLRVTSNVGSGTITYVRDALDRITARTGGGDDYRYGFEDSGDVPAFQKTPAGAVMERVIGLPGGVTVFKRAAGYGPEVWSIPNLHGDNIVTTDAAGTVLHAGARLFSPDGKPVNGIPASNVVGDTSYGWLGQHGRPAEGDSTGNTLIQMGARPYLTTLGRFLGVDPTEQGNTNDYNYPADPINEMDLTGEYCLTGKNANGSCRSVARGAVKVGRFTAGVAAGVTVGAAVTAACLGEHLRRGDINTCKAVGVGAGEAANLVTQRFLDSLGTAAQKLASSLDCLASPACMRAGSTGTAGTTASPAVTANPSSPTVPANPVTIATTWIYGMIPIGPGWP